VGREGEGWALVAKPDPWLELFRLLRDALGNASAGRDPDDLAALLTREVGLRFSLRRSEHPVHAAFEADLQDALSDLLADDEIASLSVPERAGVMAASLLAILEDKWAFTLRDEWLRGQPGP
jgi:hypothetical protein